MKSGAWPKPAGAVPGREPDAWLDEVDEAEAAASAEDDDARAASACAACAAAASARAVARSAAPCGAFCCVVVTVEALEGASVDARSAAEASLPGASSGGVGRAAAAVGVLAIFDAPGSSVEEAEGEPARPVGGGLFSLMTSGQARAARKRVDIGRLSASTSPRGKPALRAPSSRAFAVPFPSCPFCRAGRIANFTGPAAR
ncbi:protein of unknown function [Paraburkholderia kururiensis]